LRLHPLGGGAKEPTGSRKEEPGSESEQEDGVFQTAA